MREAYKLYLHRGASVFGGVEYSGDTALAVIVGVPYEETTSYKPGTRFAPQAVRTAAANIEFYSPRARLDLDTEPILDLGDVAVTHGPEAMAERLRAVAAGVSRDYRLGERLHVYIGGEHTITLGLYSGVSDYLGEPPCIVSLDAHLDMRSEYLGARLGHATFMRRLLETHKPLLAAVIGARAYVSEEERFARGAGATLIGAREILAGGPAAAREVIEAARSCSSLYITVDMDVYDPAYAPGVGNPEPEGLAPSHVFDIIHSLIAAVEGPVVLDVVEASPPNDCNDITSVLAAKTILEAMAAYKRTRGERSSG